MRKRNINLLINESIIAHLLSNLTCSMRFDGVLNLDLNEITMNLVPYPELHLLTSSIVPLYSLSDTNLQPRKYYKYQKN